MAFDRQCVITCITPQYASSVSILCVDPSLGTHEGQKRGGLTLAIFGWNNHPP